MNNDQKNMLSRRLKKVLMGTIITAPLLFLLTPLTVGLYLIHPRSRKTIKNPNDYGMNYEHISFTSSAGNVSLSGWWVPAKTASHQTVIIAHGYRNERSVSKIELLNFVRNLHEEGYHVLMFDFRNSGTSGGRQTSIGYFEQHDLKAAIDFAVNEKRQKSIALLGFSMGAATSLIVGTQHPSVKAIIADSPFSELHPYLQENLSVWSKLPNKPFTPMILFSMERLLRFRSKEVSPLKSIQIQNDKAYLLIHSKKDASIPYRHSELLFQHLQTSNIKELWLTEEAAHIRSYLHQPDEYAERVIDFLFRVMK